MSYKTTIPCPECQADIIIDSALLLSGAQFKCSNENCTASISIDVDSIERAREAINQFESLRNESIKQSKTA